MKTTLCFFLMLFFIGGKYYETDRPVELDGNGVLVFKDTKRPVPEKDEKEKCKT